MNPQLRPAAPIPPTFLLRRPLIVRDQGAIFVVDHAFAAGGDGVHVVHLHHLAPDQLHVAAFATLVVALQCPQKVIDRLQTRALGRRTGHDVDGVRAPGAEIALEARFRPLDGGAKSVSARLVAAPGKDDVELIRKGVIAAEQLLDQRVAAEWWFLSIILIHESIQLRQVAESNQPVYRSTHSQYGLGRCSTHPHQATNGTRDILAGCTTSMMQDMHHQG